MAGITGATLASIPNFKINRTENPSGNLIYPIDMKDDSIGVPGQDRISFTVYKYNKKINDTIGPNQNNSNFPFPNTTERLDETKNFEPAFIRLKKKDPVVVKSVFLPVQDKIQDQNSVTWGEGTLNDIQRRLANLSFNIMNADKKGVTDAGEELVDFLTNSGTGNLGRLAAVEAAVGVQNLLSRATASILNPNLELLFEKPTLRPFTFNFRLSPRSEKEAGAVKNIIKFFKTGMAPIYDPKDLFLKAPYVFKIRYHYGSKLTEDHPGINRIKMCALQSCVTDYTPNNVYMTYRDGTMISYNINLTFQELIPLYDVDYNDDHSIGY
jgi:hypothetical protein